MNLIKVSDCTEKQRSIIYLIADSVGCPVHRETRDATSPYIFFSGIGFDGEKIVGVGSMVKYQDVSFSEFITELLKHEKPKVWVTREGKECQTEINFRGSYTEYTYRVYSHHRNPKFTFEVEQ